MNYVKPSEINNYLQSGIELDEADRAKMIQLASLMVDSYCRRSLAIKHYVRTVRFNASGTGRVGVAPFVQFSPVDTTTGLRIWPRVRTLGAGWKRLQSFSDITIPSSITDLIIPSTGLIQLEVARSADYGRQMLNSSNGITTGPASYVQGFQGIAEFYAGYFVETTVIEPAAQGAQQIKLDSLVGVKVGKTKITIADQTTQYRITSIVSGTTVSLNKPLAVAVADDAIVNEVVPEAIKAAVGMIIADRLTYEPNTSRTSSDLLDLLKSSMKRINDDMLPVDAQEMLKDYRYERVGV